MCVIGTASAAIGAGLEIISGNDRRTRANLNLLASAESGSGKSQVFRRIAQPMVDYQNAIHDTFRDDKAPKLISEHAVISREIANLEKKVARATDEADRERMLGELNAKNVRLKQLELENVEPSIICGDVTSEKLAVMIAANRETMFSASPEARQIVDIVCGKYNAGKTTDEAIYLSGFSGDYLRVDRLGRDAITLRRPCLSVLWFLQPDALRRLYETESLMHSGFLARFLVCETKATPQKIGEGNSDAVSDSVLARWSELIKGFLKTYHAAEKAFCIEATPEAKRLLDNFFNEIVDRRQADLSDVGPFASRLAEQAWRVALTFHAALHGIAAHEHPLHAETADNAIAVVKWFLEAQLNVLARRSPRSGHENRR